MNLGQYGVLTRLFYHGVSILSMWVGTRMTVIGLTGGIACGKSTVIDTLRDKCGDSFKIIDCDKITHDLYEDPAFVASVFKTFGKEAVVAADGKTVDRAKLGAIVFADKAKRAQLNRMTHGPIFASILKSIIRLRLLQREPLVVLDAPLLFETRILEYICHPILVVSIDQEAKQCKRLMDRNKGLTKKEAMAKIASQMPLKAKRGKADILIDNEGTKEELQKRITTWVIPQILKTLKLSN